MLTIGISEARKRFSQLLRRAVGGEAVVITRHGKPMARLIAAEPHDRDRASDAVARLKRLRQGTTLGLSWKMLRGEGRR